MATTSGVIFISGMGSAQKTVGSSFASPGSRYTSPSDASFFTSSAAPVYASSNSFKRLPVASPLIRPSRDSRSDASFRACHDKVNYMYRLSSDPRASTLYCRRPSACRVTRRWPDSSAYSCVSGAALWLQRRDSSSDASGSRALSRASRASYSQSRL